MICERQPGWEELTFDEQAQLLGRQGVHYLIAEPVRDGYIELRDRKKDIIVSGGENISTIAVEQAIAEHHAVAEVAVVSTPDEPRTTSSPSPRSTSPDTCAPSPSRSPSCRRPPRGRFRRSNCATRSGPDATAASGERHAPWAHRTAGRRTTSGKVKKFELRARYASLGADKLVHSACR